MSPPTTDPARDDAQVDNESKSKEPTMTDTAPLPTPEVPAAIAPEAPPTTPPPRGPVVPTVVLVLDKVSETIGACIIGALAWHRVVGAELAVGAIVLLLTGNNGIRALGASRGGAGLGVVGLLLLAAGGALGILAPHAPAVADAAAAMARRG